VLSCEAAGSALAGLAERVGCRPTGQLYLGEATVKTHINRIFATTRSRDRVQAIAYAGNKSLGL
jgi:hypothetical protein